MTRRTMILLIVNEEREEPEPIDTEGAELDEPSRIVQRDVSPALAKCAELLQLPAKKAAV